MQGRRSSFWNILFCTVLILQASFLSGAEVLSSRPAGVLKITVGSDEQKMVSLPFKPFDSSLEAVMAGQLTGNREERVSDRVMKWDGVALRYEQAYKADGTGNKDIDGKWYSSFDPLVESAVTLKPGEGFVIWNRQGQLQDVYLAGDVVLDVTNKVVLNPALNMVGYPYSSSGTAPSNMTFRTDNGTGYVEAANLEMGKGYWVENSNIAAEVWTEIRPYAADVFPPAGSRPDILWINAVSEGGTGKVDLVLTIDCEGLAADEKLDIYYQNLPVNGVFDAEKDWLIAEQNMPVHGRKLVEWVDSSASLQPAASGLQTSSARYYLIGRASVDLDKNGIPDCRERFVKGRILGIAGMGMQQVSEDTEFVRDVADKGVAAGASRISRIIYVDRKMGADHFTGRSAKVVSPDGPKKTIRGGLNVVEPGDVMIIKDGDYKENLNLSGKDVRVFVQGKVRL